MTLVSMLLLAPFASAADTPIQAVLVSGGHEFDEKVVLGMFDTLDGIKVTHAPQTEGGELFEDISDWAYDVIVFYNMEKRISKKRRDNLVELLDQGVGVVALHHAMGAYPRWREFRKIIGGIYLFKEQKIDDATCSASTYKHDIDFTIHVEDADHPITKGLSDFTVHDETYAGCWFAKDNHVLLTTDDSTSDKTVAWTRTYANAKVCTIQMGHGLQIFSQAAYKQLMEQAIRYCATVKN